MIVDSSAIVAIFRKEPRWETLVEKLSSATGHGIGAPTLVETGIVLEATSSSGQTGHLLRFLVELEIEIVPFTEPHGRESISAWRRYGKGRHPAALNFGDCLTYAVAKLSGEPLLAVGHNFEKTDLRMA